MNRIVFLPILVCVILLGSVTNAYGNKSGLEEVRVDTPYPDKDKVVKVETLQPEKGSDVAPLIELIHYKDQTVAMHFQVSGDPTTKQLDVETTYDISINTTTKTYKAKVTEEKVSIDPNIMAGTGSASHAIKIQAYDPIRVLLTETFATYAWNWNNGVITANAGHDCGAQNPTAAGTHWFKDDCWRNEFMSPLRNEGSVQATGKFSNQDWKWASQWTFNHQWVYLSGRDGGAWVIDAWQRPTGEDSFLIFTKIIVQ